MESLDFISSQKKKIMNEAQNYVILMVYFCTCTFEIYPIY
jgi:hypothetical protein